VLLARVHGTTSSRASWTCQNTPGTSLCQFVQIDTHAHTHTAAHILQCSGTDIISFQAGIVATFHTLFCFVCNIGRQISSPAKTETSAIKKKKRNLEQHCQLWELRAGAALKIWSPLLLSLFFQHNFFFFLHECYLTVCKFTQIQK